MKHYIGGLRVRIGFIARDIISCYKIDTICRGGYFETIVTDEYGEKIWCYSTKGHTQALETHNIVMWCLLVTGELPVTL